MATYRIEVGATAERQLRKLDRKTLVRLVAAIQGLADHPCPAGCRKLQGWADAYRLRVGQYRIIYTVSDPILRVLVLKVGNRGDVYP
jgi:mRNA interferase RelE/StbE